MYWILKCSNLLVLVIHFITLDVLFVQFVEMLLMESMLKTRTGEQFAQKITVTMIRSAIFVKCLSVMKQEQYQLTIWSRLVIWFFTLIVSSKIFENFLIIFIIILWRCQRCDSPILSAYFNDPFNKDHFYCQACYEK